MRSQVVPASAAETFSFFSDAENLQLLTPPFLHFTITTPRPIRIAAGTLIEYRLRLFGVPFFWKTRIELFEPPRRFVDVQLEGPYRRWRHLHEVTPEGEGARVTDVIEYAMPGVPLAPWVHAFAVRPALVRIFDYRRERVARALSGP